MQSNMAKTRTSVRFKEKHTANRKKTRKERDEKNVCSLIDRHL